MVGCAMPLFFKPSEWFYTSRGVRVYRKLFVTLYVEEMRPVLKSYAQSDCGSCNFDFPERYNELTYTYKPQHSCPTSYEEAFGRYGKPAMLAMDQVLRQWAVMRRFFDIALSVQAPERAVTFASYTNCFAKIKEEWFEDLTQTVKMTSWHIPVQNELLLEMVQ